MSNVSFLTIHGMGETPTNYADGLNKKLANKMEEAFNQLNVGSIYYQELLQENERRVWRLMENKVSWNGLRQFLLFGFGDAAGLENGKEYAESVYTQTQVIIAQALWKAFQQTSGQRELVILAHSLGGHVISCYLWDANVADSKVGAWRNGTTFLQNKLNNGKPFTADELDFLRGKQLKYLYTTGCNIPIFVAAHAQKEIVPANPNPSFKWHNFYDRDDVLGWPLSPLSDKYKAVVEDHAINANNGLWGWLLKSWNPFSHSEYWEDGEVLSHLAQNLRAMLTLASSSPHIKNDSPNSPFFQD